MMQERNIINGTTTAVVAPLLDFYNSLIPFLILAIVLILVDSRFEVAAAKKRGGTNQNVPEKWRRAINKLVDYICWVTLAGLFGQTFGTVLGIPILSALLLLVVYGIELSSCYNNYLESRGINKKVNIFKLFGRSDVENCIEDVNEKKEGKQ